MPSFSARSMQNLSECHPDLQRLFSEVIKHYDCTIIEGHRGENRQQEAFHAGKSKLEWPDSNHNQVPSVALDASPYPVSWSLSPKNMARCYNYAGVLQGLASQ